MVERECTSSFMVETRVGFYFLVGFDPDVWVSVTH